MLELLRRPFNWTTSWMESLPFWLACVVGIGGLVISIILITLIPIMIGFSIKRFKKLFEEQE